MKVGFVSEKIGTAYDLATANCWHLAAETLSFLYGVEVPTFRKRDTVSRRRRVAASLDFQIWQGWMEATEVADGDLVLMARSGCEPDLHAGVFIVLPWQSGILHTNDPHGTVFETIGDINLTRNFTLRFFRPIP